MVYAGKNSNSRGRNGTGSRRAFPTRWHGGSAGKRVRTQKETDRGKWFPGSEICTNPTTLCQVHSFSICVHREDAATVSYTEVRCSEECISMSYRNGNACLTDLFDFETSLAFSATANPNPVNESCAQTSI